MMQEPIQAARKAYRIDAWGSGYYSIDDSGEVCVSPSGTPDGPSISLQALVKQLRASGIRTPVLIRFLDILAHRIRGLSAAFGQALQACGSKGVYTPVYPIKVNQQQSVVKGLLEAGRSSSLGLEAGSKPELMAVLSLGSQRPLTIVCNGYKDREFMELALIGQKMGHRVFIVVEKPNEIDLLLDVCDEFDVQPNIGVRVKLSSSASGKWQNSGGDHAKFGLDTAQLLSMVGKLEKAGRLSCLNLLHAHIGSQITSLTDIRKGLREMLRFYQGLIAMGAPLSVLDIGGGLGIDYEGSKSDHFFSIDYSLHGYARAVVETVNDLCQSLGLAFPEIITESGRALTAHHGVLLTDLLDIEDEAAAGFALSDADLEKPAYKVMARACLRAAESHPDPGYTLDLYHELTLELADSQALFINGKLSVSEKAWLEQCFNLACRRLLSNLDPALESHRLPIAEIENRLAINVYANFSVFQSTPDVWGISQVFPVVPVSGHHLQPTHRAVVQDITCDSDGKLSQYVYGDALSSFLPLPHYEEGENFCIGFFLVGAYQEILGDPHNLFGETAAVSIVLDPAAENGWRIQDCEQAQTLEAMLSHVHYASEELLESYRMQLGRPELALQEHEQARLMAKLSASLESETYLSA